jgi:hypothetical protein
MPRATYGPTKVPTAVNRPIFKIGIGRYPSPRSPKRYSYSNDKAMAPQSAIPARRSHLPVIGIHAAGIKRRRRHRGKYGAALSDERRPTFTFRPYDFSRFPSELPPSGGEHLRPPRPERGHFSPSVDCHPDAPRLRKPLLLLPEFRVLGREVVHGRRCSPLYDGRGMDEDFASGVNGAASWRHRLDLSSPLSMRPGKRRTFRQYRVIAMTNRVSPPSLTVPTFANAFMAAY